MAHCLSLAGDLHGGAGAATGTNPGSPSVEAEAGGVTDNVNVDYALEKVLHPRVMQGLLNNQLLSRHVPKGGWGGWVWVAEGAGGGGDSTGFCARSWRRIHDPLRVCAVRHTHTQELGRERVAQYPREWFSTLPLLRSVHPLLRSVHGTRSSLLSPVLSFARHQPLRECAFIHGHDAGDGDTFSGHFRGATPRRRQCDVGQSLSRFPCLAVLHRWFWTWAG